MVAPSDFVHGVKSYNPLLLHNKGLEAFIWVVTLWISSSLRRKRETETEKEKKGLIVVFIKSPVTNPETEN